MSSSSRLSGIGTPNFEENLDLFLKAFLMMKKKHMKEINIEDQLDYLVKHFENIHIAYKGYKNIVEIEDHNHDLSLTSWDKATIKLYKEGNSLDNLRKRLDLLHLNYQQYNRIMQIKKIDRRQSMENDWIKICLQIVESGWEHNIKKTRSYFKKRLTLLLPRNYLSEIISQADLKIEVMKHLSFNEIDRMYQMPEKIAKNDQIGDVWENWGYYFPKSQMKDFLMLLNNPESTLFRDALNIVAYNWIDPIKERYNDGDPRNQVWFFNNIVELMHEYHNKVHFNVDKLGNRLLLYVVVGFIRQANENIWLEGYDGGWEEFSHSINSFIDTCKKFQLTSMFSTICTDIGIISGFLPFLKNIKKIFLTPFSLMLFYVGKYEKKLKGDEEYQRRVLWRDFIQPILKEVTRDGLKFPIPKEYEKKYTGYCYGIVEMNDGKLVIIDNLWFPGNLEDLMLRLYEWPGYS